MPKRRRNSIEITDEGGSHVESNRLNFSEAKELFLRDIRLLSPETQRWHRENLTAVEKALLEQNIDVSDVGGFTARLIKEHVVFYMFENKGLKPNTINGRVRSVRALSKFLSGEGYIDKDFGVDIPLVKGERVIIEALSQEQVEVLLRQPNRKTFTGLRDYTLMLLLFETGIRIAECINIDLDNVRLKEGQILIHGKGARQRLVPFQSKFRRILQSYLNVRGPAETQALFVTVEGVRISKRYVQELIHNYGEMAHIRDVRVSPHTFRHTMAKFYILAGGDIFSLQKILGHSTLDMVRMYVDLFSSDVQTQHRKFSFLQNHLR